MGEKKTILSLMIKEHKKIEALIDALDEQIDGEFDKLKEAFSQLEWQLEKHLFMEEKAIFTMYEPEDINQGYNMLPTVTTHHNEILNRLGLMRHSIQNGQAPQDLYKFKTFLVRHRNFEEKDLYPKLEDVLTDAQKEVIIDRINEII